MRNAILIGLVALAFCAAGSAYPEALFAEDTGENLGKDIPVTRDRPAADRYMRQEGYQAHEENDSGLPANRIDRGDTSADRRADIDDGRQSQRVPGKGYLNRDNRVDRQRGIQGGREYQSSRQRDFQGHRRYGADHQRDFRERRGYRHHDRRDFNGYRKYSHEDRKKFSSPRGNRNDHRRDFRSHPKFRPDHKQQVRGHRDFRQDHKRYYSYQPKYRKQHFAGHERYKPTGRSYHGGSRANAHRR